MKIYPYERKYEDRRKHEDFGENEYKRKYEDVHEYEDKSDFFSAVNETILDDEPDVNPGRISKAGATGGKITKNVVPK